MTFTLHQDLASIRPWTCSGPWGTARARPQRARVHRAAPPPVCDRVSTPVGRPRPARVLAVRGRCGELLRPAPDRPACVADAPLRDVPRRSSARRPTASDRVPTRPAGPGGSMSPRGPRSHSSSPIGSCRRPPRAPLADLRRSTPRIHRRRVEPPERGAASLAATAPRRRLPYDSAEMISVGRLSVAPVKGLALQHPEFDRADRGRGPRGPAVLPHRRDRPPCRWPHRRGARPGRAVDGPGWDLPPVDAARRHHRGRRRPDGRGHRDAHVRADGPRARRRGAVGGGPRSHRGPDPVRLIRTDEPGGTRTQHQASLVSDGSLGRLGDQLGVGAVDGRRFRMLIELRGGADHEEDTWIGGRVALRRGGPADLRPDPSLRDHDARPGLRASATSIRSGRSANTAACGTARTSISGSTARSSGPAGSLSGTSCPSSEDRPRSARLDDEPAAEQVGRRRPGAGGREADRRPRRGRSRPHRSARRPAGRPAGRRSRS